MHVMLFSLSLAVFEHEIEWLAEALPDGGYWYLLGMRLGMPENEMKVMKSSASGEDQCKSEILRRWRSYSRLQPTMHTLLQALHSIGLKDLAQQLSYSHGKTSAFKYYALEASIHKHYKPLLL